MSAGAVGPTVQYFSWRAVGSAAAVSLNSPLQVPSILFPSSGVFPRSVHRREAAEIFELETGIAGAYVFIYVRMSHVFKRSSIDFIPGLPVSNIDTIDDTFEVSISTIL